MRRFLQLALCLFLGLPSIAAQKNLPLMGVGGAAGGVTITYISSTRGCVNSGGTGTGCTVGTGVAVSATMNVIAGDKIVGFCRSSAGTSFTVVTSATDTVIKQTAVTNALVGVTQLWWIESAVGGAAVTFTCTSTDLGGNFTSVLVKQFRGGLTSSIVDANVGNTQGADVSNTTTSSTFSTTTGNQVVVFCTGVNALATGWTLGLIGGTTATNLLLDGPSAAGCEHLIETTTQSSITAKLTVDDFSGDSFANGLGSFK